MKKVRSLALAGALMLLSAACSSGDGEQKGPCNQSERLSLESEGCCCEHGMYGMLECGEDGLWHCPNGTNWYQGALCDDDCGPCNAPCIFPDVHEEPPNDPGSDLTVNLGQDAAIDPGDNTEADTPDVATAIPCGGLCDLNANCQTVEEVEACVCNEGYTGDGITCAEEVCEGTTVELPKVYLDIFFLLDQTGSMGQAGVSAKWTGLMAGLEQFFNNSPGGESASISKFPYGGSCDFQEIELQAMLFPLPDLATGLIQTIESPSGGVNESIGSALWEIYQNNLDGAFPGMESLHIPDEASLILAHPDHKVIVVLITDTHLSDNCSPMPLGAAEGMAFEAGMATYVIGYPGANFPLLDEIALAGGTNQVYLVGDDISVALEEIRNHARKDAICNFSIPENGTETVDPGLVNVKVNWSGDESSSILPYVGATTNCALTEGWHFDDPFLPTRILLCPELCEAIASDPDTQVLVNFGCPLVTM